MSLNENALNALVFLGTVAVISVGRRLYFSPGYLGNLGSFGAQVDAVTARELMQESML